MTTDRRVGVTAMFSTGNGATCLTQAFSTESKLEEIIVWAQSLETGGRTLLELICDLRAGELG